VLEGDDFWPPDKLARQLPAFEQPDVVLSWGRAGITDEAGVVSLVLPRRQAIERLRAADQRGTLLALLRRNVIPASTVVVRRTALEAIGGFQQPAGMPTVDYPTWLALWRMGRLEPMDHVLGYHRRHGAQVTARLAAQMMDVVDWGWRFASSLPPAERDRIGLTSGDLERVIRRNRADRAFWQGRAALREGRREEALEQFRRAVRDGGRLTRAKGLVGYASGMLGMDLERLAAMRPGRGPAVEPGTEDRP
jgi:hypothetical protein